jgi:sporulation protein YlmC with PRC-barrel domain
MRVDLDAKVLLKDGEEAGSVQRAVLDPDTDQVSHFVVSTGGLFGRDVLVPRDALEGATRDGDSLRVDLTKDELEKCEGFVPSQYTVPPTGWVAPVGYAWPHAGYAWPLAYPYEPYTTATDRYPEREPDEVTINKGAMVVDRAGDDVGVVDDVLLNQQTGRLEGFVVRVGGAFRTLFGGGETVRLERDLIDRVREGVVQIRVDKETLRDRAA